MNKAEAIKFAASRGVQVVEHTPTDAAPFWTIGEFTIVRATFSRKFWSLKGASKNRGGYIGEMIEWCVRQTVKA